MSNSPYSNEHVRKGVLHYLLGRGFAGLAGFLTIILMVRYMDVQGYAGFTALSGLIAFSGICAGLGLDRAISRYVPEARMERSAHELGKFIWLISTIKFVAALSVSLIFYFFWEKILKIFPDVHLVSYPISLTCFVIAETLFQHFSNVLQALIKQKALTRILIVQWLGRLIMIGWAMSTNNYISLNESLWIMAIPEMVGVIIFIILLWYDIQELKKTKAQINNSYNQSSWPNWTAIYKMAANNYGFTLLAAPPQGYFMKMLAAIYLPANYVAAYGFFLSLAERARQYIPLHFFYNLLEPVMIARYLNDKDFSSLNYRCQLLYKSNLLLLVPAIAWVAVSGDGLDLLLTAGKFQGFSWILVLVLVQLTIGSHVVLLQLILNSVEKSFFLIKASINALPIMLVAVLIAIKSSPIYLLFTPLIFSMVMNTSLVFYLRISGYPYSPSWKMQGGVLFSGVLAFILVEVIKIGIIPQSNPLVLMAWTVMTISLFYLLSIFALKAIDKSELILVRSLFKS